MSLYQLKKYPQFLLKSKNQHGVHSPFVFELIHEVFSQDKVFYSFGEIERQRGKLLGNHNFIEVTDFGAGSQVMNSNKRKISDIAKHTLTTKKNAEILFRIANKFQPKTIVELGTSLGIMTAYLGKSCPDSTIYSLEGCPNICSQARVLLSNLSISNASIIEGNMDKTLPELLSKAGQIDFAFIDGNHRKEPTISYTKQLIEKSNESSIMVLDDIYWSEGMNAAWEELKQHSKVTLSIDIFDKGFLFFRKGIEKQHFYLRV